MEALQKLSTMLSSIDHRRLLAEAATKYLDFLREITKRQHLSCYVAVLGRKECVIYRDHDGSVVQVIRVQDLLTKES